MGKKAASKDQKKETIEFKIKLFMQNSLGRMGVKTSLGPKNLSDETFRLCLDCKSRAISDVKKIKYKCHLWYAMQQ